MSALSLARAGFPQLRIHYGDQENADEVADPVARLIQADPRLAWRLREFFDNWSMPQVFAMKSSPRASGTIDGYENMLRYWEQVSDDPTLAELLWDCEDQQTIDFVGLLPEWGFSRRGMRRGEPILIGPLADHPTFEPLKSTTVNAHATRLATLLHQAGPQYNMRERVAKLLDRRIYVPTVEADFEPKTPFEIDEARQIATACARMTRPVVPHWIPLELWWQTRLALFYYTGLRAGTVRELAREHLVQKKGRWWLDVPKSIVRKTKKAIRMVVHPHLLELLTAVEALRPAGSSPHDLLLPMGCVYRNFLDLHSELQQLAGLSPEQRQSPHAWRRTHCTQIGELGFKPALELAQAAADHASSRTTQQSYVPTLVDHFRVALPRLF